MPIDELKLQALRETMASVNHVVLNRLMVIRMVVDEVKGGKPLTDKQIEFIDQAVFETTEHLYAISELDDYETHEIIKGVYAVKYTLVPAFCAENAQ